MGKLPNNSGASNYKSNYLFIINNQITQRVDAPTATSKERTNKNGIVVHEETFGGISGLITNVTTRDGSYGKELHISLFDAELNEYNHLQLGFRDGFAISFLFKMLNIDYKIEAEIRAYFIDNKRILSIKQNGEKIQSYWTKENKLDLPDLEKIFFKGEEHWDDTKRVAFFEQVIEEKIKPVLIRLNEERKAAKNGTNDSFLEEINTGSKTEKKKK